MKTELQLLYDCASRSNGRSNPILFKQRSIIATDGMVSVISHSAYSPTNEGLSIDMNGNLCPDLNVQPVFALLNNVSGFEAEQYSFFGAKYDELVEWAENLFELNEANKDLLLCRFGSTNHRLFDLIRIGRMMELYAMPTILSTPIALYETTGHVTVLCRSFTDELTNKHKIVLHGTPIIPINKYKHEE